MVVPRFLFGFCKLNNVCDIASLSGLEFCPSQYTSQCVHPSLVFFVLWYQHEILNHLSLLVDVGGYRTNSMQRKYLSSYVLWLSSERTHSLCVHHEKRSIPRLAGSQRLCTIRPQCTQQSYIVDKPNDVCKLHKI